MATPHGWHCSGCGRTSAATDCLFRDDAQGGVPSAVQAGQHRVGLPLRRWRHVEEAR